MRRLELAGRRFGRWTVIEYAGEGKWLCKCDCGTLRKVSGACLNNGRTKSCGCTRHKTAKPNKDLSGKTFGMLYVVDYAGKGKWHCRCSCGGTKTVKTNHLKCGSVISCGCIGTTHQGLSNRTHGESKTRLFHLWCSMKSRCFNKTATEFEHYGGRGISVCDEWKDSFVAFRDWAYQNGYDPDLPSKECTLDRIDVNGNYTPDNCRWVSMSEQLKNKRPNKYFKPVEMLDEHGAVVSTYKTIAEAARELGICASSISNVCNGKQAMAKGHLFRFAPLE